MPAKTQSERISELNPIVRLDSLINHLESDAKHSRNVSIRQEERNDSTKLAIEEIRIDAAVTKHRVEELAKHKDETGRRIGQLIFTITGVLVGSLMIDIPRR